MGGVNMQSQKATDVEVQQLQETDQLVVKLETCHVLEVGLCQTLIARRQSWVFVMPNGEA